MQKKKKIKLGQGFSSIKKRLFSAHTLTAAPLVFFRAALKKIKSNSTVQVTITKAAN
jgi:hypothetical protein